MGPVASVVGWVWVAWAALSLPCVQATSHENPHHMPWVYSEKDYFTTRSNYAKTETGLTYALLGVQKDGRAIRKGDTVRVLYKLFLKGHGHPHIFSQARPSQALEVEVGLGNVIAGFDEALLLMNYGSRGRFLMPGKIGYGRQGSPVFRIPPDATLDYYLEVLPQLDEPNEQL